MKIINFLKRQERIWYFMVLAYVALNCMYLISGINSTLDYIMVIIINIYYPVGIIWGAYKNENN